MQIEHALSRQLIWGVCLFLRLGEHSMMSAITFCHFPSVRPGLSAPLVSTSPRKRIRLPQRVLSRSIFAPGPVLLARRAATSAHDTGHRSSRAPSMVLGKVVVAGGTGFIGSRLVRRLVDSGSSVTVLTRSASAAAHLPEAVTVQPWLPDATTAGGAGLADALRGADLLVNLCGAPVVARWDDSGRQRLVESRTHPTGTLARGIAALPENDRPACVVSASAVGYYGTDDRVVYDEGGPQARNDFLADLCGQWEAAAAPIADLTRLVIVRIGVVTGVGGGALSRMLPVFRLGLGGPVGSGRQYVSWIHVDDLVSMFVRAGETTDVKGVYNGVAPNAVTMNEFSAALARALKRPNLFPVPGFVLRIVFGKGADVVLSGQRVTPTNWLKEGFEFKYPNIDDAMQAVAKEV